MGTSPMAAQLFCVACLVLAAMAWLVALAG